MATHVTNVSINKISLRDRFEGVLASIASGFVAHLERKARTGQIAVLNAKSDAELAEMGLNRRDIPHYVFRDMFYI